MYFQVLSEQLMYITSGVLSNIAVRDRMTYSKIKVTLTTEGEEECFNLFHKENRAL